MTVIAIILVISACTQATTTIPPLGDGMASAPTAITAIPLSPSTISSQLSSAPTTQLSRVDSLLQQMTLEEKIGQMTQVEKDSIKPGDITRYFIGSILSGGGEYPPSNTVQGWADMVDGFQREALQTRLAIPIIYGVDATHGHAALYGATVFPQESSLGATRDASLVYEIGRATAEEMLATGIRWNFAPIVAVPQDIRWGRTYESYSEDTALVSELGAAFVRGLQAIPESVAPAPGQEIYVLATPKHYLGDGGTAFGSSAGVVSRSYLLDQGNTKFDESSMRRLFLIIVPLWVWIGRGWQPADPVAGMRDSMSSRAVRCKLARQNGVAATVNIQGEVVR